MTPFTHKRVPVLAHTLPRTPISQRRRGLTDVGGKATSPHVSFYKNFGRPVAKVFLMAFFTYQITYWAWVKMEKEEVRSEKEREVLAVEEEVLRLRDGVKGRGVGGSE